MLHVVSQRVYTSKYCNRQRAIIEKGIVCPGILSTMEYHLAYFDLYNAKMSLQSWIASSYHVKDVALIGTIVTVCIWTVIYAFDRWNTAAKLKSSRLSTPDLEKKPSLGSKLKKSDRKPGGMRNPSDCASVVIIQEKLTLKNGHHLTSRDQQHHRIQIGIFIRRSPYRTGHFDMDRKLPFLLVNESPQQLMAIAGNILSLWVYEV